MKTLRNILLMALLTVAGLGAQDKSVLAVTDISLTNVSETKGMIAYEFMLNEVNRSGLFSLVERAALDQAIEEMQIAATGIIDESTAAELGRLVGARQIIVSSLILEDEFYYLSMRILEVETGEVLQTAVRDIHEEGSLERLVTRTIEDLIAFLYVNEEGQVVQLDQIPGQEGSNGQNSDLLFSLRPLLAVPLGKTGEAYPMGAGLMANVDYRAVQMGPVYLTLGLQSGFILEQSKENISPTSQNLQIPAALQGTFWIDLGSWYFNARIGGGIAYNQISFDDSSLETDQQIVFALYPGLSAGHRFSDTLGVALFCDYNIVFQEEEPFQALLSGISLDIKL